MELTPLGHAQGGGWERKWGGECQRLPVGSCALLCESCACMSERGCMCVPTPVWVPSCGGRACPWGTQGSGMLPRARVIGHVPLFLPAVEEACLCSPPFQKLSLSGPSGMSLPAYSPC